MTRFVLCLAAVLLSGAVSQAYDKAACDAVTKRAMVSVSDLSKVFREIQDVLTQMSCTGNEEAFLARYLEVIKENSAMREEGTRVCDAPPIDYRKAQEQNIATVRNHIAYCKKARPR